MAPKRVLMIAFHFPPATGGSGLQRTLRFVQHLPRFGWEAIVLTAHSRAFEQTSTDLLAEVPPGTTVVRATAFDAARHFSIAGRYPGILAVPDRWASWRYTAVQRGMRLTRDLRPQVIWSTYPIATAHMIGGSLAKRSGLPWVADFRDPMAQDGYPKEPRIWRAFRRIEERVFRRARTCTFTAPTALETYRARYPESAAHLEVLENGYDESAFAAAEADEAPQRRPQSGRLTLLHSGIVYPDERDPAALFGALARIADRDRSVRTRLCVRFRAAVHEDLLQAEAARYGVTDIVEILPPIPYREAIVEMLHVDGLLVMQAASCDQQIPAKVYEYLRSGRPLVALVSPSGDTARLLVRAGLEAIAPLDDVDAVAGVLERFLRNPAQGTSTRRYPVASASRIERARQLAAVLDASSEAPPARANSA